MVGDSIVTVAEGWHDVMEQYRINIGLTDWQQRAAARSKTRLDILNLLEEWRSKTLLQCSTVSLQCSSLLKRLSLTLTRRLFNGLERVTRPA